MDWEKDIEIDLFFCLLKSIFYLRNWVTVPSLVLSLFPYLSENSVNVIEDEPNVFPDDPGFVDNWPPICCLPKVHGLDSKRNTAMKKDRLWPERQLRGIFYHGTRNCTYSKNSKDPGDEQDQGDGFTFKKIW